MSQPQPLRLVPEAGGNAASSPGPGQTADSLPPEAPELRGLPRPPEAPPAGDFQPEITAFTCNYCGYMAADTAGALRASYSPNVKLVRLPCTGKTDLQYLLDAFEQGADGVYVVACGLGNCHHERGNERGRARVQRAKALLETIGLEPERLDMFFVSGGMGATFAEIARGMVGRIRALGPSPLRGDRRTA
jgi:coenzyme F420-reducing hydrogenase delta subunit